MKRQIGTGLAVLAAISMTACSSSGGTGAADTSGGSKTEGEVKQIVLWGAVFRTGGRNLVDRDYQCI